MDRVIQMEQSELLLQFCRYAERVWINSSIWPPTQWSGFMQHRRTKNNAEGNGNENTITLIYSTQFFKFIGYHNSLKLEVLTNSINLIKFIRLLKEEANKIDLKAKLLSQKQILIRTNKGKKKEIKNTYYII